MSVPGNKTSGRVWDPLVRLFHWTLVAAFATAWFVRSEAAIHETAGKVVLVLVILRAAWGLVGTGSARFETFIKGPITTLRYVISIMRGKPAHYLGHNPAGAAMIGALLLSLTATTVSGVLMTTTAFWGSTWIEWIHGTAATLTVFLIAGHLLGVIAACFQHRENLLWSMVTGRKWVSVNTERFLGPTMFTRRRSLAALALIATGFGVWSASGAIFNASYWRMPKIIKAEVTKGGCEVEAVSGPQIVVYPAMQVQYEVTYSEGYGSGTAAVPTELALQKRPKIDVSSLVQDCKTAFESKSNSGFGFADVTFASLKGAFEAAKAIAVIGAANAHTAPVRQIGLSPTPAAVPGEAETAIAAPPVTGAPVPNAKDIAARAAAGKIGMARVAAAAAAAGEGVADADVVAPASEAERATAPNADTSSASPEKDGGKILIPTTRKLNPKKSAVKSTRPDLKTVPARAKPANRAVKKVKKKAVVAKPLARKVVRKELKRKKTSSSPSLAGRRSGVSGGGSSPSNGGSNSSSSGSGTDSSGSDDDGDDNSGSGSTNSGSGSSGSGSNSGSGGGDDDD